ncbi:MAG: MotA/TolQ/ExbB proton channel family protein [Candidatus Cloacimonetes bacterium]|nr:MotA/TolQ/ExbB proton channel family protein [Candidatus Cloacimonadota bacterium]
MKAKHTLLVVLALAISIGFLHATPQVVGGDKVNLGTIFQDSGFFGYLILLTFLVGIIYAIIRWVQLYQREKLDASNLYLKLKGYIKNDQIDEAIRIAESFKNTTLGFIFWSGLMGYKDARKVYKDEELNIAVQNSFDEAVLQSVHKIDSGLFWFDTLAQVCTYLGLLGTIWGVLEAFAALSSPNVLDSEKNILLTRGIKVAIGTTALGLLAAIPLTLIKGAFTTRAQRLINDVDEFSVKLINHINSSKG